MDTGAPEAKKPKLVEISCDIEEIASSLNQPTNDIKPDEKIFMSDVEPSNKIPSLDVQNHGQPKGENKPSLTNGSGQKLESIIGRLSSDKTSIVKHDRMDSSTQTVPDFWKRVKLMVLKRMKQLEQSLIGGAVADSVLNGKLAELHKENKELREKTKILQNKVDQLLNVQKEEGILQVVKDREVINNGSLQNIPVDGGSASPIIRQSAVVSPYNVQGSQGDMTSQTVGHLEANRTRIDASERQISRIQGQMHPYSKNISMTQSNATSQSHPPRQGPQVKYVPHKLPVNQGLPGGPSSQFVQLGQEGLVMQRLQPQHSHSSVGDHGTRHPNQQVVYTNPPIQVTGPRMSTLPPQPVKQHHGIQRPMLSPINSSIRLAQPTVPPGSSVCIQGPPGQTVHYVPQGMMPGYASQVQPNFSQDGHRIPPQVPNNPGPAPPSRNTVHGVNDFRIRPSQLAPPPYQGVPRNQVDTIAPPKLQVNITVSGNGIVLSWDFETDPPTNSPVIECYHLFASQDSPNPPTSRSDWKKIGVVKALPLPMACTLTQFVSGNSYHFAVIAIDVHGREGQLSNPCTVRLNK